MFARLKILLMSVIVVVTLGVVAPAHAEVALGELVAPTTIYIYQPMTVSVDVSGAEGSAFAQFQLTRLGDGAVVGNLNTLSSNGAVTVTFPASSFLVVSQYRVHVAVSDATNGAPLGTKSAIVTMNQKTSLTMPSSTGVADSNLTVSATLAAVPGTPPGASVGGLPVQFTFAGLPLTACQGVTDSAGVASCSTPATTAGTGTVTATFAATGIYESSSTTAAATVLPGRVGSLHAPSTTYITQPVIVSVDVSGADSSALGQFQLTRLSDGAVVSTLFAQSFNGVIQVTFAGSELVVVSQYRVDVAVSDTTNGDPLANRSATITMNQKTALALQPASAAGGGTLTFHATLRAIPTSPPGAPVGGLTVQFSVSGLALSGCQGVTDSAGDVSCTTPASAAGAGTLSATFGSTGIYEGSAATSTVTVAYGWSGFSQPVDNDVANKAKAGQAIPLKWHLTDPSGLPVTDLATATVTVVGVSCSLSGTSDPIEEYATSTSGLKNLGGGDYQFNWKTLSSYAGTCKTLRLDLGDGAVHTALFQFVK